MCRAFAVFWLMTISFLLAPQTAFSEVYRWVDESGEVFFSDKKPRLHESEPLELKVNSVESASYDASSLNSGKKVIMYSTNWCGVCKKARRYFEKNGIKYKEYDIEKSAFGRAAYRKLNARGVPVIMVGKRQMNGFNEAGFEKLYQ